MPWLPALTGYSRYSSIDFDSSEASGASKAPITWRITMRSSSHPFFLISLSVSISEFGYSHKTISISVACVFPLFCRTTRIGIVVSTSPVKSDAVTSEIVFDAIKENFNNKLIIIIAHQVVKGHFDNTIEL